MTIKKNPINIPYCVYIKKYIIVSVYLGCIDRDESVYLGCSDGDVSVYLGCSNGDVSVY